MSVCNDPAWRLTLFSPEALQPSDMADLAFVEKEHIPGAPCEIMRIIDPPLFLAGSVQSLLPMNFHITGRISRENYIFQTTPRDGGTRTSVCFSIEPCPGAAARIQWERQVAKLEEAVTEASKATCHQVQVGGLVTREQQASMPKIRVVDLESRTNEEGSGYTLRTADDTFTTVPDGLSIPFDQAMRVVFAIDCMPMPKMGTGWWAFGRIKTIGYV